MMAYGLTYTLRLLEPVLANSLAGDANSARSLPFVPGGLIRGALISLYLRQRGKTSGDAANDDFRRLFLSGETRYLHAYAMQGEARGMPIPMAWKKPKYEGGKRGIASNLAWQDSDAEGLEGLPYVYWWQRGETAEVARLSHQINVHTQRDALFGRAREGQGAVFRYEALPSGMLLRGVILAKGQKDIDDLRSLFSTKAEKLEAIEIELGKGRTAGYGRVCIENIQDLPRDWREGWRWTQETTYEEEADYIETIAPSQLSIFVLTFLSAGLVRNRSGQFTLDPLPALHARLGINVRTRDKVFRGREIVGGFNRAWGLPLPQVGAIQAGSVFVIEADSPVSMEKLQELEDTGIGERRAEGFGRVSVDLYQPPDLTWAEVEAEKEKVKSLPTRDEWSEPATRMAELVLRRLLRQELDERLLKAVRDHPVRSTSNVPNSQLSRWRTLIRSVRASGTPGEQLQKMTTSYAKEKARRSYGWRAMERARVGVDTGLGQPSARSMRLTEWIFSVLTDQESPWKYFNYPDRETPAYALGEAVRFEADEDMRMEYRLRLIDGVLKAMAKPPTDGGTHG